MEPTEVGEFAKEMKEGGEASMTQVSLIISVLAVMVAMVTVMGHRTHTEAVLTQSRAADQWNEYQDRKIRAAVVSGNMDLLSLQPSSDGAAVLAKLQAYKASLDKWKQETDADADKAKEDEFEVNIAERRAARWDLSEAMLEIAVVLSSITLLTRLWRYALAGVILGIAGICIAASTLLVR
jgi:hypothetical protein